MSELVLENKRELPTGWSIGVIEEMIDVNGKFVDGDWVETKDQDPDGDIRLIQLADIGIGVLKKKSNRFMNLQKAKKLNCTFLRNNDILVARMPDPLGRACIFPANDKKCVTVVDVAIIRTGTNRVDPKWLMHIINSPKIHNKIHSLQSGTTRKRISRKNLSKILFPIPPLNEQKRIVSKIEELFSEIDFLIQLLKKITGEFIQYKNSLLTNAFLGNISKDWRTKNLAIDSGKKLLESLFQERKKNYEKMCEITKKENKKKPSKPDNLEDSLTNKFPLFGLPENWIWCSINSISKQITDGEHLNPKYIDKGNLLLSAKNIRDGFVSYEDVHYINDENFQKCQLRCKPEVDDILIVSVGATTGRTAIVKKKTPFAVLRSVLLIKPEKIIPEYILRYLQSPTSFKWLTEASGSTAQAHLYIRDTKMFPFPLPPLEEQKFISEFLERQISYINTNTMIINQLIYSASQLRESILNQAFSGKLVPQDPNDESSEILLQKIKQEKEQLKQQEKKPRGKKNAR